ncbi:TetR/AcrR family transcriptional regulator [Bradyrhizobium sp. ARR65]|uniref:TetR/AcrR family transcriptional regulator n=1 Tax=Bradyrhizobium sp. ARR65 TaxID=1040989 RepID=UPI0007C4E3C7|nr:TetR/AcrR family transcriptional regulator [Bradyrhizobium sp. ARR65]
MAKKTATKTTAEPTGEAALRRRILEAAFSAFMEAGFAETSTLEIATRAKVSKRDLYALFGSKHDILTACIRERAKRFQLPGETPAPDDRESFGRILATLGARLMREISDPAVITVFRLAIAEAFRAPEMAETLNTAGIEASRSAVREIMARACAAGLADGQPAEMADQFAGLLWRNQMVSLLLGVLDRPSEREAHRRAEAASAALLRLYPAPDQSA